MTALQCLLSPFDPAYDSRPMPTRFTCFTIRMVLVLLATSMPGRCPAEGLVETGRTNVQDLQETGQTQKYAGEVASMVEAGIGGGEMPGAVVVIAGPDSVHYARAFGHRQLQPTKQPMTLDTIFDLASLTKPIATATSVMKLVEQGKVELDVPVAKYLPEFGQHGKEPITVADLLLHVGGLIPDNALRDYDDGVEKSWQRICELKPIAARGEKFAYTDVGFIVLGELVRRVGGRPLDQFAAENLFQPLGMTETGFNPSLELCRRAAPTEKRDQQWIKGQVHDPRAYRLNGVAGHAGLFASAADLVRFGQMMLGEGTRESVTVLSSQTVATMIQPQQVPRGTRTYGWDHRSPYSRNRGDRFSGAAFGHGGFTGTVMWIDPDKQIVFVFLSNRLHPDGKGSVNGIAGKIASVVAG